jgi:hypothetical protein
MNRLALALAVASGLLTAPGARAQTAPPTTATYVAVDGVALKGDQLTITGVVQGDSAATTRTYDVSAFSGSGWTPGDDAVLQTCTRFATLAMTKPGAFLFVVQGWTGVGSYPGCTLARATP